MRIFGYQLAVIRRKWVRIGSKPRYKFRIERFANEQRGFTVWLYTPSWVHSAVLLIDKVNQ